MLPKIMVVLGIGGSCTSGIAGSLHHGGWPMGVDYPVTSPIDVLEHYEDKKLVAINEKILVGSGALSIYDIPKDIALGYENEIGQYIESRGSGQWGMKDPRMVLTWPLWEKELQKYPLDVIIINVLRNQFRVAQSLANRDKQDIEKMAQMVKSYHSRQKKISAIKN